MSMGAKKGEKLRHVAVSLENTIQQTPGLTRGFLFAPKLITNFSISTVSTTIGSIRSIMKTIYGNKKYSRGIWLICKETFFVNNEVS